MHLFIYRLQKMSKCGTFPPWATENVLLSDITNFAILPAQRHLVGNSFIVQCRDVEAAKDSTCCWEKIASHRTPHGSVFIIASDQGMHGHEFDYQLPNVVLVTYKINTVLLICIHRASLL